MMTVDSTPASSRPLTKIAESLERRAAATGDTRLRRILRVAACQALDEALRSHAPPQPR